MLANVDGICEHPELGACIFEAKTASAYKAGEWEDTIPDEYMCQVQHYMAVTGYQGAYIAVLIGGNTFRWKFVERDEELISMLLELESAFWNHVQDCTPPPLDGSDASKKFLSERFPSSTPSSHITLPDAAADLLAQYNDFGSKDGESNAKACKESVLLFLLRPGSIIPLLVRVPVTSKPRFLKYSTRLLSTLTPISSVVTKITLEKATSKQGKPYALFNFEAVGTLTPEEAARAREFGSQFMEIVNAARLVPELADAS